jgi:hypothetical protein
MQAHWTTDSSANTCIKMVPQSDGTVSITDCSVFNNGENWTYAPRIGYDSTFGYWIDGNTNWTTATIYTSKDYINGGAEKTAAQFFSGNWYSVTIGLSGSTGLIAYLQETPIFLGGYYSIIPAQEIYLNPNSNNYIYFSRDKDDRTKINIENYPKLMGDPEQIQFNRILVSNIVTDSANPISQTDYVISR